MDFSEQNHRRENEMILCTECYIQKDNKTLMMHRVKKENDVNKDKWIGLGGKFEGNESPEECLLREVKEEAGVTLTDYKLMGVITFATVSELEEDYYIFLYTANTYEGEIGQCDEGELEWIDNDKITSLNLWKGDKLFWGWIFEGKPFFSAKFIYDGDKLISHDVHFYLQ